MLRSTTICLAILCTLLGGSAGAQECLFPWMCQGMGGRNTPPLPLAPNSTLQPDSISPDTRGEYSNTPRGYARYAAMDGGAFPVPAVELSQINPVYLRQEVNYPTSEAPGTVVIDPRNRFLYLVEDGGRAIRYGVGVGREGFGWSGVATIHDKREWPDWYPPKEMFERQPEIMKVMTQLQSGIGMHGGPGNPLGARAMYLWQGNKDTLYRIHGTIEPWTIGTRVSSGCIRMINQDAIDLYERVQTGTKVVVLR